MYRLFFIGLLLISTSAGAQQGPYVWPYDQSNCASFTQSRYDSPARPNVITAEGIACKPPVGTYEILRMWDVGGRPDRTGCDLQRRRKFFTTITIQGRDETAEGITCSHGDGSATVQSDFVVGEPQRSYAWTPPTQYLPPPPRRTPQSWTYPMSRDDPRWEDRQTESVVPNPEWKGAPPVWVGR